MSKIAYANKQTAVDPNSPAANEVFTAANANEVKTSVNALYDLVESFELPDGFVSGPELETINDTTVAVQTNTQGVALVYNANGTKYTVSAGTADQTFSATPHATYDRACIIQGNGVTISLKQGSAGEIVVKPIPDSGYVELYSFTINTTGISNGGSAPVGYATMNTLNSGDMNITGAFKVNGTDVLDGKVDKVSGKGLSTEDYTTAEKTKLGGIASGATANDTDANLKNRSNHTGTQTASTISDFNTAAQAAVDISGKANIEATATTGTAITFTEDKLYGSVATPETGNITANVTGAKIGATVLIIHNSGSAPTFDSKFAKLSGSGDYVTSSRNYISCQYINATKIIYSINQEA